LLDIKLWPQPMSAISLQYDSKTTMSRAYNNIYTGKSSHISIRHGYVWKLITNGVIIIVYVKSVNNLVDLLIKRLSRNMIRKKTSGMRLKPVIKDIDNENFGLEKSLSLSLISNSKLLFSICWILIIIFGPYYDNI